MEITAIKAPPGFSSIVVFFLAEKTLKTLGLCPKPRKLFEKSLAKTLIKIAQNARDFWVVFGWHQFGYNYVCSFATTGIL